MVGESNVPLTKDVIRKPDRDFSATFSEWAADNVEQIIAFGLGGPGVVNSVVFSVPKNFTLFITSAFITCTAEDIGHQHGEGRLRIAPKGGGNRATFLVAAVDHLPTGPTAGNQAVSFPMPLVANPEEEIRLVSSGLGAAVLRGGVQGYLLPKKISIR